jgi:hypothetical protein
MTFKARDCIRNKTVIAKLKEQISTQNYLVCTLAYEREKDVTNQSTKFSHKYILFHLTQHCIFILILQVGITTVRHSIRNSEIKVQMLLFVRSVKYEKNY